MMPEQSPPAGSLSRRLLRAVRQWTRHASTTPEGPHGSEEHLPASWERLEVTVNKPASGASLGISLSGGGEGLCARVSGVRPGSAAHSSDAISVGDYITAVNGVRTERLRADQVASLLHRADTGPVTLELLLPPPSEASSDLARHTQIVQVSLQRDDGSSLGFNLRGGGVHRPLVVTQVRPGGPADRSGCVRPGDRLLGVDGMSLMGATLQDAHDLLRPPINGTSASLVRLSFEVDVMPDTVVRSGPFLLEVERAGGDPAIGLALTACGEGAGVLVAGVRPGSVAYRCGALHPGDLILAVGGTRVHEGLGPMEAAQLLAACGSPIRLQVLPRNVWGSIESGLSSLRGLRRAGSYMTSQSTLTSRRRACSRGPTVSHAESLVVSLLPDECGYGIALEGGGVIAAIDPGSPADLSGCLQPGDRILAVNQRSCEGLTCAQVAALMDGAQALALQVQFEVAEAVVPASGVFTVKLAVRGTEADLGLSLQAPRGSCIAPVISEVRRGSVAHRSGALQPGDQILEVGDVRVSSVDQVSELVNSAASQVVSLRILKGTVEEEWQPQGHTVLVELERGGGLLGVTVAGTEDAITPITISALTPGGLAERSGALQVGDQLLTINGQVLEGRRLSEAIDFLQTAGERVVLQVFRTENYDCSSESSTVKRRAGWLEDVESNSTLESSVHIWPEDTAASIDENPAPSPPRCGTLPSARKAGSGTPSSCLPDVYQVTLHKDRVYEDFGFSVSDGLYERGVYINRIRRGGPADLSGRLRPYDRILQVNDTRTQDFDCCLTVPLIATAGDTLELTVARNPFASLTAPDTDPVWVCAQQDDTQPSTRDNDTEPVWVCAQQDPALVKTL